MVREKVQEMLDKEDKDFSGVLSTAKTALTLYSDPLVANNTSASDFAINDLVNHERPVSLYLVVPPSDKIRLASAHPPDPHYDRQPPDGANALRWRRAAA